MRNIKRADTDTDNLWDRYWNDMSEEWFKVEALQDYTGEDISPSLEEWLKGNKTKSTQLLGDESSQAWVDRLQQSSFKKVRIHIVKEPYTSYLAWEIEHYKHINIPLAGEEVYLVRQDKLAPEARIDFCIFDQKRVAVNNYDETGYAQSTDFYDESDDISKFLAIREELLRLKQPL